VVLPHARLVERGPAPKAPADRPLRIAYAGMPAAHKGWEIFRDLAVKHADDPRYHFLHLGGRPQPGLALEFHKVTVTDDRPRAMQEAIEKHQADAVLIWPLCRETFSFIAYEAVAAGAAIIAGPDSGNVAAFVAAGGHGLVLDGEDALARAFETGEVASLARSVRKPALYDLAFSALTVDLLEGPA
jgi:Glycosyl transferases group 1